MQVFFPNAVDHGVRQRFVESFIRHLRLSCEEAYDNSYLQIEFVNKLSYKEVNLAVLVDSHTVLFKVHLDVLCGIKIAISDVVPFLQGQDVGDLVKKCVDFSVMSLGGQCVV